MRILSFDCANITLGYAILDFEEKNIVEICSRICGGSELEKEKITIPVFDVVNLLNKKVANTNIAYRTTKLVEFLNKVPAENVDIVLVEYQMMPNVWSHSVQDQIMMYYMSKYPNIKVFDVKPALKNTIAFSEEGLYQNFIELFVKNKPANKAHSAFNCTMLMESLNIDIKHLLHLNKKLNKKMVDNNLADAIMQAIAYVNTINDSSI